MSTNPKWLGLPPEVLAILRDMRVLDTVDWYSPPYHSKHTYEEVFRWFESSGPDSLRVLYEPVAVQGRKPLGVVEANLEEKPCAASQVS